MYDFTKQGVSDMAESLSAEWGDSWDRFDDKNQVEITINGRAIQVPLCADNCNAIVYMLRDMLISDMTGEATIGNTREAYDEQEIKFNSLGRSDHSMTTEKLYSPLEFYIHNPRKEEASGEYGTYDLYDERYQISPVDAGEYMDDIELAVLRDRDRMDQTRGMAEYLSGTLDGKVESLFPSIENYGNMMACVAEIKLTQPLTPEEAETLKDWWSGQLSDGWGEGFEQREIKISGGEELYIRPWTSDDGFFIDTEREFMARLGLEAPAPTQDAAVTDMAEQPLTEMKFYSPVHCTYWSRMDIAHDDPDELTDQAVVEYISDIRAAILNERMPKEAERGLMAYYDTDDSIGKKVQSIFVDVEVHAGKLWAAATLKVAEPLTADEISSLKEYLADAYSDIIGDRLSQNYIDVEGGEMVVALWKDNNKFHIETQAEFSLMMGFDEIKPSPAEPSLTPAQMALYEPDASEDAATAALREKLIRKVTIELSNYFDDWQKRDAVMVMVDRSLEIASMTNAYHYLTEIHNFHASELEYLLKFKKPLKVVAREFEHESAVEEHSDIMWKVFHEQEALHNGRHALDSSAPDESLINTLKNRLSENYSDYMGSWMALSKEELIGDVDEVSMVCQMYGYFIDDYVYTTGQAEFLLKLENPLEFLSNRWSSMQPYMGDAIKNIFADMEQTLQNGGYALMPDTEETETLSRLVSGSGEKPSVLAQIRQHTAEQRERPSPKRDATGKKKTGPEL
ncbi:MAG: hypothetical protein FWH17_02785 [Oscillospiraceae bacterium]|nr:hypothetical protein [Oscillospiraceae bacterium]